MASPTDHLTALSQATLQAFDDLNGYHAGFRPAHAKGILLSGTFTPSAEAKSLTRAPHIQRESTPVTVRFSDFAGFPQVADNDPQNSGPRGIAIRFHLAEHVHTDIIAHSVDGFPTRTAEEFVEFLRAAKASGPGVPHPTPVEVFLGAHPKTLAFLQTPKPIPSSFAKESYFSATAYQFEAADGSRRYGRYRIRPEGEGEYLDEKTVAAQPANFLHDEITGRIAKGPVQIRILVQLAESGDIVDDATEHWPESRPQILFGTVSLTAVIPESDEEKRRIIFDPIPRVDGIGSSGDPLLEPRAAIYLASGRRRRKAAAS